MSNSANRNLFSLSGLVLAAVLFIALVLVVNFLFRGARIDLTEAGLYSISDGTERIVDSLEEPIELKLYFSRSVAADVPRMAPYAQYAERVRELLEELVAMSGGQLSLQVVDPLPFSEAEDEANSYGVTPVPVTNVGETMFLGLVGINAVGDVDTLHFLDPARETFLEYDVARLISGLDQPELPKALLMTDLPMGAGFDPATRQMREPWVIVRQLQQTFDMTVVPLSTTEIDDDVQAIMLVHPKSMSDAARYAVDQFVMGGGNLIVFVDPHAEIETPPGMDVQQAMQTDKSSNLPDLFSAWGISYDPTVVALDATNGVEISAGAGRPPVRHIGVINLTGADLNDDEVVLANLSNLYLALAGVVGPADSAEGAQPAAEWVNLITTSVDSSTTESQRLRFLPDPQMLLDDFQSGDERLVLAGRMSGPLDSAFPDGPPASDDGEPRDAEAHLGRVEAGNVLVVGDVDMLADRMWVQVQSFFGQQLLNAFANNGDFVLNAMENFAGSDDLIAIRGRATSQRPFVRVQALERAAEERFRETEKQLEQELRETERNLTELQSGREDSGSLIMSSEQQAELQRFRDQQIRIRGELRAVRANLRADIERLGTWVKAINLLAVPLLLIIGVIVFVVLRRQSRKQAQ